MTVFEGILLGLLQGVAEFLPISSSGHLKLLQNFLGLEDVPLLFDVFLHLPTLLVVFIFFRGRIWELLCAFFRTFSKKNSASIEDASLDDASLEDGRRRYILGVIIVTALTGFIGILTKKKLDALPVQFICVGFLVTASLLIISAIVSRGKTKDSLQDSGGLDVSAKDSPKLWQSVIVGVMQGVGTLPGVSRSGSTISASLLCGVNRSMSGEFSFIVSIPAILGAFLLDIKDLDTMVGDVSISALIAGFIAAFVSGYIALYLLMKIIKRGHLEYFAAYLIPVGIIGLFFLN